MQRPVGSRKRSLDEARGSGWMLHAFPRLRGRDARLFTLLLFATIAAIDLATGAEISLRALFVLPVAYAGWCVGRVDAIVVAAAGLVSVALLDLHGSPSWTESFVVSDAITRFVAFVLVGELAVRARAQFEDRASRLKSVLAAASDVAIIECDASGALESWNSGVERLLGWRMDEMDEPHPSMVEGLVERARTGHVEAGDWTVMHKDGAVRTLRTVVIPRHDEKSALLGYVAVAVDVSESRRAEAAVRATNEELKAFAYTVSHDLKAPLRGIAGYAQELQRKHRGGLAERALFCVDQIQTAAHNLDRLIDELLRYSRLIREDVVLGDMDLESTVRAILRDRRSLIEEQGTQIDLDFAVTTVHTWERAVLHILANLIDNALKYSKGSRPPKVRIESGRGEHGTIRLRVTDNGIGFEQKYAERIFGLFSRLSQPAEYPGTGVGLAIVQRMARKIGGEVSVTSSPGEGASFVVAFPESGGSEQRTS